MDCGKGVPEVLKYGRGVPKTQLAHDNFSGIWWHAALVAANHDSIKVVLHSHSRSRLGTTNFRIKPTANDSTVRITSARPAEYVLESAHFGFLRATG